MLRNVAGGWNIVSGNATSFSSIGSFSSPSVTTSGEFSNLNGFVYLSNPPQIDPSISDADGDGLPDTWERVYGLSVTQANASDDSDGDSLTNLSEFQQGTNPNISDTDEDGLSDGDEINLHSSNPLLLDSDGDGYEDAEEVSKGSSPVRSHIFAPGCQPAHLSFLSPPDQYCGGAISGTGFSSISSVGSGFPQK